MIYEPWGKDSAAEQSKDLLETGRELVITKKIN